MRIRKIAAGIAMVIALAGAAACDGNDPSSSSHSGKSIDSTGTKKPRDNSKAAGLHTTLKGIDFCKALSAKSLTAISVQPSDAQQQPNESSDTGKYADSGCEWKSGETLVGVYAINNHIADMSDGEMTINISGFPGTADNALGNTCFVSLQINGDELEVNVEDLGSSNQALEGRACDVAKDFAQQALAGVTTK